MERRSFIQMLMAMIAAAMMPRPAFALTQTPGSWTQYLLRGKDWNLAEGFMLHVIWNPKRKQYECFHLHSFSSWKYETLTFSQADFDRNLPDFVPTHLSYLYDCVLHYMMENDYSTRFCYILITDENGFIVKSLCCGGSSRKIHHSDFLRINS